MKQDNKKALYESIMKTVSAQVKKALNESAADGWNLEGEFDQLFEVLDEIESFTYEIKNCVRGAYTGCETYEELGGHLRNLAESLLECAGELEGMEEPEPESEDDYYENDEE